MNTAVAKKFSVKPLVAAVALTVTAGAAVAAPPLFAVPGAGMITAVNAGTTFSSPGALYTVTGAGAKGDQIHDGQSSLPFPFLIPGISINNALGNARGVIQWGGNPVSAETKNAAGFNIGEQATLVFTQTVPVGFNGAILNIDGSGSPSFIMGSLWAVDTGFGIPALYVSNSNGIFVGEKAIVSTPSGLGLIGANLANATALNDFVGNNSTATSFLDVTDGQSKVEIHGNIGGNFISNTPASFLLVAGGDIVNTGNTFASFTWVDAGMRRVAGKATVNGVANTVVNRLWDVDGALAAGGFGLPAGIVFDKGVAGGVETASASSFVNTGSMSVDDSLLAFGWFLSTTSNGFRSGTQGSTDPALGIFADNNVIVFNYSSGSKIDFFNSVKGYSLNKVLPLLTVNSNFFGGPALIGSGGDVTVDLLTVGSLPSSLTTTDTVQIFADNITINSTINHKLNSQGGVQTDVDLLLVGSKSVTINKAIGAGQDVIIQAKGPITTAVGGDILSDTDKDGDGGILIFNNGTQAGNATTINGNLATSSASVDNIEIWNNGIASSKLIVNGNVTTNANNFGDIEMYSNGSLDIGGTLSSGDDINLNAFGNSVMLRGPMTAAMTPTSNGLFSISAPFAQTKLFPTAVITSPAILLGWDQESFAWQGIGSITGVNASGAAYTSAAQKPATQLVTNNLVGLLFGSMNAPIAGNTNWLLNQVAIDAQDPAAPVAISLSQMGAGPQYVNLGVKGDVWIDSGLTATPFFAVGLTSGTAFPVGPLIGNGGSSLIVNATGQINVVSNSGAQGSTWVGGPGYHTGPGGNAFFEQPGGTALISGTQLSSFVPMYNAWTETAAPFQGIWLEAPAIQLASYVAMNNNAWLNLSSTPITPLPNVYIIERLTPDSYGFKLVNNRAFYNTYSKVITGTPVNNCPIGFVC